MALVGQTQDNGNASVLVNSLGPTTHIVSFVDAEAEVAAITGIRGGAVIAGIDTATSHMAVQTTADAAVLNALTNVAVVATFTDNYPKA